MLSVSYYDDKNHVLGPFINAEARAFICNLCGPGRPGIPLGMTLLIETRQPIKLDRQCHP